MLASSTFFTSISLKACHKARFFASLRSFSFLPSRGEWRNKLRNRKKAKKTRKFILLQLVAFYSPSDGEIGGAAHSPRALLPDPHLLIVSIIIQKEENRFPCLLRRKVSWREHLKVHPRFAPRNKRDALRRHEERNRWTKENNGKVREILWRERAMVLIRIQKEEEERRRRRNPEKSFSIRRRLRLRRARETALSEAKVIIFLLIGLPAYASRRKNFSSSRAQHSDVSSRRWMQMENHLKLKSTNHLIIALGGLVRMHSACAERRQTPNPIVGTNKHEKLFGAVSELTEWKAQEDEKKSEKVKAIKICPWLHGWSNTRARRGFLLLCLNGNYLIWWPNTRRDDDKTFTGKLGERFSWIRLSVVSAFTSSQLQRGKKRGRCLTRKRFFTALGIVKTLGEKVFFFSSFNCIRDQGERGVKS